MRRAASFLLIFQVAAVARADEYLMVFSSDSTPYSPTQAHTFAAVVSVEEVPGQPPRVVDLKSLSWLPATMKVRALAPFCEPGRNVPLHETLRHYLARGGRVCMWGPYRIRPEFAHKFRAHVAEIESSYKYKGACFLVPGKICDCTRSVEVLVATHNRFIGACGYGAAAASHCVQKLSIWMIEPEREHPWVATMIGLDGYSLVRRPFGDYTSRWDQLRSMFGR